MLSYSGVHMKGKQGTESKVHFTVVTEVGTLTCKLTLTARESVGADDVAVAFSVF